MQENYKARRIFTYYNADIKTFTSFVNLQIQYACFIPDDNGFKAGIYISHSG